MEQKVITFKQAFEALKNKIGNNSLFDLRGEKIIPLNNRIRLIFMDSLDVSSKFSSRGLLEITKKELMENVGSNFEEHLSKNFVFIYNPTYYRRQGVEIKHSTPNEIVAFSKQFGAETKICIQQDGMPPRGSFLTSTEQLGTLITMLYFREKGYIVQKPRTYGREGKGKPGVDDVVAWKSPVIDELRKFGFIDRGCHISELACLRWLGKVSNSRRDFDNYITKEILLTEVEPSKRNGISNSPSMGINQLLRAAKVKIAKKTIHLLPCCYENVEEIFREIKNKNKPVVGAILFDDKGVYIQDSETFPDENMLSEIEEYENHLKRALLNNFYFDEILEMIKELGVDTKSKGVHEVLLNFRNKKVEEIPTSYILEKLNRLLK